MARRASNCGELSLPACPTRSAHLDAAPPPPPLFLTPLLSDVTGKTLGGKRHERSTFTCWNEYETVCVFGGRVMRGFRECDLWVHADGAHGWMCRWSLTQTGLPLPESPFLNSLITCCMTCCMCVCVCVQVYLHVCVTCVISFRISRKTFKVNFLVTYYVILKAFLKHFPSYGGLNPPCLLDFWIVPNIH